MTFKYSPELQTELDRLFGIEREIGDKAEELNIEIARLREVPVVRMTAEQRRQTRGFPERRDDIDLETIAVNEEILSLSPQRRDEVRDSHTEKAEFVPEARAEVSRRLESIGFSTPADPTIPGRGDWTNEMVTRHEHFRSAVDDEQNALVYIQQVESEIKRREELVRQLTDKLERRRDALLARD